MFGRKTLTALMAFVLVLSMVPSSAFARGLELDYSTSQGATGALSAQATIAEGIDGTCKWEIDGQGALTISPRNGLASGQLSSYDSVWVPWYDYRNQIRSVSIDPGVKLGESCTSMFSGCKQLESAVLRNADASDVVDMSAMFNQCQKLKWVDLSGIDTSQVTDMGSMFNSCSSLESVELATLNTSRLKDASGMFSGCSSLTFVGISAWDTSSVTDMNSMFDGCSSLKSLDLHKWNTSNVTGAGRYHSTGSDGMGYMFNGCSSLETLDIAGWDTSRVTTMTYMFANCASLKTVYVDEAWSTLSCDLYARMFEGCTSIVGQSGTPYDSRYTDVEYARVDASYDTPGYLTYRTYNVANATTTLSQSVYEYTGSPCMPSVTVVLNGKTLIANRDYYVSYSNNVNAGAASVIVRGMGDYIGEKTIPFQIQGIDLSRAIVTPVSSSYVFTGDQIQPPVTVTLGGNRLSEGADYTVSYSANRDAGIASIIVQGKGSYSGVAYGSFRIDPVDISSANVSFDKSSYAYTGREVTPAPKVVLGGTTLSVGEGYTATYSNNTSAGTAKVSIAGWGNYSGTAAGTFTITSASESAPATPAITSLVGEDGGFTVKWKASKGATGYHLKYSTSSNFASSKTRTVVISGGTATKRITGLANGQTYYVKVSAFRSGEDVSRSSGWSAAKAVLVGASGKMANPMTVKPSTTTLKAAKVKQGNQTVKCPLVVRGAKGKVTYKLTKVNGSAKKFSMNKANGKVTIKKGTAKGTYKLTIKVSAAGNSSYRSASKSVTATIAIK